MAEQIQIKIITPKNKNCACLICPFCGAHEVANCEEEDVNKWRFNIRAFKVDDKSKCLKCGRWF